MMAMVNFFRHPYLIDHLTSSLKENCTICLNRMTSKELLLCYICNEFVKQTNKPCLVLTALEDSDGTCSYQFEFCLLSLFNLKLILSRHNVNRGVQEKWLILL